jgi:DNA-binding IclR family transcriptional regulator
VKGLPRFTDNTLTSKSDLLRELDNVRRRGYAFDNEECEKGARCVAVPVRDFTRKIVAAISVTGSIFRMTDEMVESRLGILADAGRRVSKLLSYADD